MHNHYHNQLWVLILKILAQCCSHLSVTTTSINVGFIILNAGKPECTHYAGIVLNAFASLLCSKLCWHALYNISFGYMF